ncbi:unnamed protein product [Prunus armeniaca]
MSPTLLDMAQIFRFRPHGRPVDVVGDYHRRKNQEKLAKPFTVSPATINQNCSFSNYKKNLHTTTLENPLNLSTSGAFWMIQIWLQVYFPELRFPDIVLLEDQVLALPLMSAEVPKRSTEEYLMFFRHCNKRSAAHWQVVIRRMHPWFQPGHRLFEQEPEKEIARTDFRKKFLSVTLALDLPFGGGKPPNYRGCRSISS